MSYMQRCMRVRTLASQRPQSRCTLASEILHKSYTSTYEKQNNNCPSSAFTPSGTRWQHHLTRDVPCHTQSSSGITFRGAARLVRHQLTSCHFLLTASSSSGPTNVVPRSLPSRAVQRRAAHGRSSNPSLGRRTNGSECVCGDADRAGDPILQIRCAVLLSVLGADGTFGGARRILNLVGEWCVASLAVEQLCDNNRSGLLHDGWSSRTWSGSSSARLG